MGLVGDLARFKKTCCVLFYFIQFIIHGRLRGRQKGAHAPLLENEKNNHNSIIYVYVFNTTYTNWLFYHTPKNESGHVVLLALK